MQMFEPVMTATIPRLGRYGRRRSVLLLRRRLRERQRGNIVVDIIAYISTSYIQDILQISHKARSCSTGTCLLLLSRLRTMEVWTTTTQPSQWTACQPLRHRRCQETHVSWLQASAPRTIA
jgi:hypothetical protein